MLRFSTRLRTDFSQNRLSRLLEERRLRGAGTLDLTESNPTQVALAYPHRAISEALARCGPLPYEPRPRGLLSAREAVAAWLGRRGSAPGPDQLLLTSGTSEAYAYLFKLLLDPGDSVLVPRPSYPLIDMIAALESVRIRPYALVRDPTWRLDFDSLERSREPRSRAVVVIHPNNPTGSCLHPEDLENLLQFCARHSLALISDEVFLEYPLAGARERLPSLAGSRETLVFCLDGLSKSAGMPQLKLGWICASGPQEPRAEALKRLDLISDAFLSVGAPVQFALPRLLEIGTGVRAELKARVESNLERLRQGVRCLPECALLEPEAGWSAALRLPAIHSDEEWALELLRDGVCVQPGYFYDFAQEAILVLSLLPGPEVFDEGVSRLLAHARG